MIVISEIHNNMEALKDMVKISNDHMSATIKIPKPDYGKKYSLEYIIAILNVFRVKAGIDKQAIEGIVKNEIYDLEVVVAKGKPAVNGVDGHYEFMFSDKKKKLTPFVNDNGTVEYIGTEEYTMVEVGDLLARYTHATSGEFGFTVDSRILSPRRGRELSPLVGSGFRIINEGTEYRAEISGKLEFTERRIVVSQVLDVNGDVDLARGHIDFNGDVIVRGDVITGMKVKSKGNVSVFGHVEGATIIAGRDIFIKQGMQGKGIGKLEAGGTIKGIFFEKSHLVTKGDVVANVIMDCVVEAKGRVLVEGKHGLILGGKVSSIENITAKTVGNEMEVVTKLSAGVDGAMNLRVAQLMGLIKKVEDEVDLLDRSAKIFERMALVKMTAELEDRRMKIVQVKIIKNAELKQYLQEFEYLMIEVDKGEQATIIIRDLAYRGTRIEIMGQRHNIRDTVRDVIFRIRNNEVIMEGNRA